MKENNPVAIIKEQAPEGLSIILKGGKEEAEYEKKRKVVNLRFNYYPYGIAFCKTAKHVSYCIKKCKEYKVKLRIRSGGHHHEGMSSANDILLIDLSGMNKIEYLIGDPELAWIPPGKKLADVYKELQGYKELYGGGYTIPGGVCNSVNVGGLTQGVGWGASTRKLGYTCDNIEAVEIVKADGEIIIASNAPDNNYRDLFWAVRGGGGGNFGVVTRFLFRLFPLPEFITFFSFTYEKEQTRNAMHQWATFQQKMDYDENVTVGGRLFVQKDKEALFILGGLYYGTKAEAETALQPLLENPRPRSIRFDSIQKPTNVPLTAEYSMATAMNRLGDILNPTSPIASPKLPTAAYFTELAAGPRKTCEGKHPNKVSSAFPRDNSPKTIQALIDATVDYIEKSTYHSDLNNYVSVHGIGGHAQQEPEGGTPYPFRGKPFIFKIQAWWNSADNVTENALYVKWVRDFKTAIAPYTDGAFINFQDKDLVENPDTLEGRVALLTHYYKEHLPRLREVKLKYDAGNLFDFGMSIPLKR